MTLLAYHWMTLRLSMSSTKVMFFISPRIRLWPTVSNGGATGISGCLL